MLDQIKGQIKGLHHVTSMASGARANNAFFTDTLGLRRVKQTVPLSGSHSTIASN